MGQFILLNHLGAQLEVGLLFQPGAEQLYRSILSTLMKDFGASLKKKSI